MGLKITEETTEVIQRIHFNQPLIRSKLNKSELAIADNLIENNVLDVKFVDFKNRRIPAFTVTALGIKILDRYYGKL